MQIINFKLQNNVILCLNPKFVICILHFKI